MLPEIESIKDQGREVGLAGPVRIPGQDHAADDLTANRGHDHGQGRGCDRGRGRVHALTPKNRDRAQFPQLPHLADLVRDPSPGIQRNGASPNQNQGRNQGRKQCQSRARSQDQSHRGQSRGPNPEAEANQELSLDRHQGLIVEVAADPAVNDPTALPINRRQSQGTLEL